jgi:HEAT repeat protein
MPLTTLLRIPGHPGRSRAQTAFLAVALASLVAACSTKPEDIERWKSTEKGPSKLVAAFADASLSTEIKASAGAALVELGLLSELEQTMAGKAPAEREAVLKEMVPRLKQLATRPTDSSRQRQISTAAKDALFSLRTYAAPPLRDAMDGLCIDWFLVDVAKRTHLGSHDLPKVFTAIGPRAAAALVPLIMPGRADLELLADLVGKLGSPEAKAQAAEKLVGVLKGEGELPKETTFKAAGMIDAPAMADYLSGIAGSKADKELRQRAVMTLAVKPMATDPVVALAGRLAGDPKEPGEVREAAFFLLEKVGASRPKEALGHLYGYLGDLNSKIRWRAVEAILAVGKGDAVGPLLDKLPITVAYPRRDVDDFLCADLRKNGGPQAASHLRKALTSPSWIARAAAVRCLELMGSADDASKLESLFADKTPLRGWEPVATLGEEAKAVAAKLKSKN